MEKSVLVTLLITCSLVTLTTGEMSTLNQTMKLLQDLMENYDNRLRPVYEQHQAVYVHIDFSLENVRSFNDVSGEIVLLGTFKMTWLEERFQWKPQDYGNITEIILPKNDVWHPDLFMSTSLNTLSRPGAAASKVSIKFDGNAYMRSTDLLTSVCPADVQNYPNDHQTCTLITIPSGYTSSQMRLAETKSVIEDIPANNEWDILEILTYAGRGEFNIEIRLKRHSMYGLMTMKIPIHLLGVLNSWVFFLPPDSGERTSYSITTFLAFTVYMGILTDNMPKGSMPVANLMFHVFIMLIYSATILLCTIISLQIHTNQGKKPVPSHTQKVINLLSFSCLRNRKTTISSMDLTQNNTKCQISTNAETTKQNKQFPLQCFSTEYIDEAHLEKIPEKDLPASSTERLCDPASYVEEMSWTHVGNIFEAYMLFFFILWFSIVTIIYNI